MDSAAALPLLLKAVDGKGQTALKDVSNDEAQAELLAAARELVSALESPVERLCRMVYLEPSLLGMVRCAIDWNLYTALMADNGSAKTAEQLAKDCSVELALMSRSLKHLASGAIIKEVDVNTYASTPMVSLLSDPRAQGTVIDMCVQPQIVSQLPYYLKSRGNKNPTDQNDSPFMYSYNTKLHYFDWLGQPGMEHRLNAFGKHMSFKDMGKKWYELTDIQEIFGNPTDPEAVLMVDVGGSVGHDLIGFREQHPNIPGRLVLQDLPAQIEKIDKASFPKDIEATGYDFFTPQPIQGAKAYYVHTVLHDWPDSECDKILRNIVPAMKKGYSKILLNEVIIPDRGAGWFGTSVDILVMMVHSAQERTETEWRNMLKRAGLKISKIWDCGGAPQKIIEAELA